MKENTEVYGMDVFRLSTRLQTAALWVRAGNVVADIGTDHGYLPIYLIKNHISEHVIAMDVRKGPLEKARKNAAEYGVKDSVDFRLSDGLSRLLPGEAGTITICGMGGRLMQRILEAGADKIAPDTQLILSPQSEIGEFRRYLFYSGFKTVREDMLKEDGQFYLMMECCKSGRAKENDAGQQKGCTGEDTGIWEEVYFRYGKQLLEGRNACLKAYIEREKSLTQKIYQKVCQVEPKEEAVMTRIEQLKRDMQCIGYALKYYE